MTDVIFIYDDEGQADRVREQTKDFSLTFTFIDSLGKKSKKNAWKIKSHYAAKLDPFAVILDKNKPVRAFYSEAEDVIESLIKYLNENESTSSQHQ